MRQPYRSRGGGAERRGSRRFGVHWDAKVRGADEAGAKFEEATVVDNLSSTGVFLEVNSSLRRGSRVDVAIRIPLRKQNWMNYSGSVVRVEKEGDRSRIAIRFDTPRPIFAAN